MGISINGGFGKIGSFNVAQIYPLPLLAESFLATAVQGNVTLAYTNVANATRTEYSLDGGPWITVPADKKISVTTSGAHVIRIRGVNQQGVSGPIGTANVVVTLTPTALVTNLATSISGKNVTVTFTPALGSTYTEYSVDGSTYAPITSGQVIVSNNGIHELSVRGANSAGGGPARTTGYQIDVPVFYRYDTVVSQRVDGPAGTAPFGYAVGMASDGITSVVGTASSKKVYIYKRTGSAFSLVQTITGTADSFGRQVTLSGDGSTLFIGSVAGKIFVYKRATDTYTLAETISGNSNFGIYPISTSQNGRAFLTYDGTHRVYEVIQGIYQISQNFTGFVEGHGTCKMSSDSTSFVLIAGGSIRCNTYGNFTNNINPSATPDSCSISGDGLHVSASSNGRTEIFSRNTVFDTAWTRTANFLISAATGNGRCDSLNEKGDIMLSSSDGSEEARVWHKVNGVWGSVSQFRNSGGRFGYHNALARGGSAMVIGMDTLPTDGAVHFIVGQER